MFLTYGSIVSAYVPDLLAELKQMGETTGTPAAAPGPAAVGSVTSTPAPAAVPSPQGTAKAGDAPQPMGLGQALFGLAVAVVFLLALAFAAPFLGGFENIIGIVIIGIGVYEAWKLNKRQVLEITGPHRVGAAAEHG
jgi:hypothetical protein